MSNYKQNNAFKEELSSQDLVRLLFAFSARIAEENNLENLLILMADLGKELVVADRCTLWMVDWKNNELWTKVAHGIDALRMPLTKGLAGDCVELKKPILINDAYLDPRFNREVDLKTGYNTKSVITVPIFDSEDRVMGVYQAVNKLTKAQVFDDNDIDRLKMTATYSGKSLESAALYKEVEETQRDLLYMLGEVGESRSKETGNHVKRVGEYSYVLAKAYGLDDEECELIRLSAPLHDIGKVAIPDAILNKPDRLTLEEFDIMKTHTSIGEELLKKSPRRILQAASIMAGQHQEKYNGTGYPKQLLGSNIHIYGRICAIADVYDALSCDRVYKKAWPQEKVLSLFRAERGEHFDPGLTDLFFENVDKFDKIREKYKDVFEYSEE